MRLWFLQLSGWPVFLTIVGVVLAFMLALSVGMTRISNRSVVQNYVLAFFAVALIAAVGLAVAVVVTRW
jgi:ABC-type arginine/histidine transport system permease subunit